MGVKQTLTILRNVEPEVYKQLRSDIKGIVETGRKAIMSAVPAVAPLSHMVHSGRTRYAIPRVTTVLDLLDKARGNTARLVQIKVDNKNGAGFEIADIAGRGSGRGRIPRSRTRPYAYKGGTRTHAINGQGQRMLENLPSNNASRYVYPAIESQMPKIQAGVVLSIETASAKINRKLDVVYGD